MNEKLTSVIKDMIFAYPYYHEILRQTNIIESNEVPAAGVSFTMKGINLYYNNDFFEKLDKEQISFIMIHEIFHILYDHYSRVQDRDMRLCNIAQDMIINNVIKSLII
jgi:predicted metal-dependent peptidase